MNKRNISIIIYCTILVAVILILYWPITKTFYQQDEWLGYGLYLAKGAGIITQNSGGFWGIVFGQGRILTNVLHFFSYRYFPMNVVPVSIFAILFHTVNTLIVFYFTGKLFKKIFPAFLGSLFFAVSSVSQGAVIWPAASINTLPSTTLILVSLIFYFKYLNSLKTKWLILGFLLIYLSIFFKETGIFLFLLLPFSSLLFKQYSFKSFIKTFWYYFLTAGSIVAYRLLGFLFTPHQEALFLTGSSKYFFDSLVIRSIFYPLTSFSLTFIPPEPFVWFARYIESVYYPFFMTQEFILIAQTVVLDLLASVFSFSMFLLIFLSARKSSNFERKNVIFFIILIVSSFLPYVLISKSYAYLESRYFYIATFAAAVLLVWLSKEILKNFRNYLLKILFVCLFVSFLGIHIKYLKNEISSQVLVAGERRSFLFQLVQQVPLLLKDKNIFYINSDKNYYVEGNKVPFQQGFGYTLMAIYFNNGKIPRDFFNDGYLFDIGGQGYREEGNYGFGYFTDSAELKQQLKKYGLPKENVIMLYYSASDQKLKIINEKNI